MSSALKSLGKSADLRNRLLYVLFILAVYRLGAHIPTPGVDTKALAEFFRSNANTLLGLFDMFSGRALSQFSIFAMGIMPYISASIIIELLTVVVPHLGRLKKEGGQTGRRKLTQYARYLTVALSLFQGYMLAVGLEKMQIGSSLGAVIHPGAEFRLMTMLTLAAGTCFIMWLGEQITERGIGNGISIIIFAGIVDGLPMAIRGVFESLSTGSQTVMKMAVLVGGMLLIVAGVVFCERAQRRIPVNYSQRVVGNKLMGGKSTHLPLKLNPAGVIPPIFASSLIMFPATIGQFVDNPTIKRMTDWVNNGSVLYNVLYVALIIFFCYFYTGVQFNPADVAENMQKHSGFVPGIRPGARTAEYIDRILTRVTLWGALYVSVICLLPSIVYRYFGVQFYFGGTALLIVVGVALDTISQIQSYVLNSQYDGFLKKGMSGIGRIQPRRRL
ncbi:MAG: preprotein translocase subunit SecY [Deltaproteobacteria bacterium]|nr:preprotein translocase subunit SecY [Deltaproteobacteria bacterium]